MDGAFGGYERRDEEFSVRTKPGRVFQTGDTHRLTFFWKSFPKCFAVAFKFLARHLSPDLALTTGAPDWPGRWIVRLVLENWVTEA